MQPVKEYPYWWDTPGLRPQNLEPGTLNPEPRELPPRADVVIVGAGYTGLAAARELARRGASVAIVERERVGWGASSRNGGQVLTGLRLDPATLIARFGEARARQLFDISLEAIATLERVIADEAIDCEYERSGHIQAANKPSHFAAFREEQELLASVFHHRVELVPPGEQHVELGTKAYHGLMIDERSAALNPAQYVEQLGAAACRAGAIVVEGAAVTRLNRQGTRWTVTTNRGAIDAGDVLVAANGYVDAAAPWLQRRFIPIGSFIIVTEPLPASDVSSLVPNRRVVFDSKNFLHYFSLTRDQRLLFGGRASFTKPTTETTRRCAKILRRDMVTVFPSLASARVEYAWGGNVAFTRDQMPRAGLLEGAYYAGGYSGHGIAMATYLGGLVARRIAGERIEHPLFDDRFAPIPFYTGTPWFLPIAGAYYRVRDWLD